VYAERTIARLESFFMLLRGNLRPHGLGRLGKAAVADQDSLVWIVDGMDKIRSLRYRIVIDLLGVV
jgi:hypothetical protein